MSAPSQHPLISILMATQNRADLLLHRSIPSVIRQTYPNWELLIRGDGAGRDTESVVRAFGDLRIRYKNFPRRVYNDPVEQWCVGGAHALNDAIAEANGAYIAHLDDDDEFLPGHLETLVNRLQAGPFDVVYGRAYYETNRGWLVFGEPFDAATLQQRNLMVHCAVMYDRARFGHLRYDVEGTEPADWRLWKKMAASGARFEFCEDIVALHYAEEVYRRMPSLGGIQVIANMVQERGLAGLLRRSNLRELKRTLVEVRTKPPGHPAILNASPAANDRMRVTDSGKIKLNIGSGISHRVGRDWIHVDLLYGADVRADVRKGLPYADNSVDFIYSEHFIEHLSADAARSFFKECHRTLKQGGVVRTATIDLQYIVERYAADWSDQTWLRDYHMETAGQMLNAVFYLWKHRFIYDEETLRKSLEQGGFVKMERCRLGRSRLSELCQLETRPESRLILEATKE